MDSLNFDFSTCYAHQSYEYTFITQLQQVEHFDGTLEYWQYLECYKKDNIQCGECVPTGIQNVSENLNQIIQQPGQLSAIP